MTDGKTMNVAHVIDSGGMYGAEMVLMNLLAAQRSQGNASILISLGKAGEGPKPIETAAQRRNIPCIPLRLCRRGALSGGMQIVNTALASGAKLVHSHGYKGDILLGLMPRRTRKVPVVSTLHGLTAKNIFSRIGIYRTLDAVLLRRFESVVAVSAATARHLIIRKCGIKPVVIPNGIPMLNFRDPFDDHVFHGILSECQNDIKLLSIGRLSVEKGHAVLIQALAKLVSRSLDVGVVIIGEGPEQEHLKTLAKAHNIADRVHLKGYCSDAYVLIPYYDALVLSSYTEGFPVTLLETMQAGTPVVATKVGDMPDILENGKCGTLSAPGNPDALAAAIEKTVLGQRQSTLVKAQKAKERALSLYTSEKMEGLYAEHYERAILRFQKE